MMNHASRSTKNLILVSLTPDGFHRVYSPSQRYAGTNQALRASSSSRDTGASDILPPRGSQMAKISKSERFLTALFDNGGELGRAQLAIAVFRRNWSAAQIDDLLSSPELRGLASINRATLRGRHAKGTRKRPRGRPSTRYSLTASGWALLASGLRSGI